MHRVLSEGVFLEWVEKGFPNVNLGGGGVLIAPFPTVILQPIFKNTNYFGDLNKTKINTSMKARLRK